MSAIAQPALSTAGYGGRRPSTLRLAASVFVGGFIAALTLWVIYIPLSLLSVVAIDEQRSSLWMPWRIDGAWALAAAVAWGLLTSTLTAGLVCDSLQRRDFERPAVGWVTIAMGSAGYGALALAPTIGAQSLFTVAVGAVMVRLVAYDLGGRPRRWSWRCSRRGRAAATVGALLIALSYGFTHALTADGSGGTYTTDPVAMKVGQHQTLDIGLSAMRLPITVRSVSVSGPGSAHARADTIVLSLDNSLDPTPMWFYRRLPRDQRVGLVTGPTRLPFQVPAGHALWISVRVSLRTCRAATINTLRLSYTVLGIPTVTTMPIRSPLTLTCARSGPHGT